MGYPFIVMEKWKLQKTPLGVYASILSELDRMNRSAKVAVEWMLRQQKFRAAPITVMNEETLVALHLPVLRNILGRGSTFKEMEKATGINYDKVRRLLHKEKILGLYEVTLTSSFKLGLRRTKGGFKSRKRWKPYENPVVTGRAPLLADFKRSNPIEKLVASLSAEERGRVGEYLGCQPTLDTIKESTSLRLKLFELAVERPELLDESHRFLRSLCQRALEAFGGSTPTMWQWYYSFDWLSDLARALKMRTQRDRREGLDELRTMFKERQEEYLRDYGPYSLFVMCNPLFWAVTDILLSTIFFQMVISPQLPHNLKRGSLSIRRESQKDSSKLEGENHGVEMGV